MPKPAPSDEIEEGIPAPRGKHPVVRTPASLAADDHAKRSGAGNGPTEQHGTRMVAISPHLQPPKRKHEREQWPEPNLASLATPVEIAAPDDGSDAEPD